MLLGLIAVFILFQWIASALGSTRGEAGVIVGLIVVAATLIIERIFFEGSFASAARTIGLGRPKALGIVVAIVIAKLMLLCLVLFPWQTGSTIDMYPNWQWLMIGLFFQAGIGEETLFRGYLFGHLRQRHTFGKAVFFAAIPFVLVHLILFYQLSWSLAGASILLAIAMSFPLSKLYELGGDTMWGPAIVHFAAQAIAKMFVTEGENAWLFPFFVIAASAVIPLAVYCVPFLTRRFGRTAILPVAGLVLCILSFPAAVSTQESQGTDIATREELTGDWDGRREKLRARGIDLKFRLTQSYQGIVSGGLGREGAYSGKFDTNFKFDMEKLVGWKRLTIQVKTETRFGRVVSAGNGLPINSAVVTPSSEGASFAVTALNFTQLIPINEEEKDFIAIGAGKYYSLDNSREPFTGGAGVTRFMGMAANGNPAAGQTIPTITNGATFAWIRKGTPFITFAIFDPVGSPRKAGVKNLYRQGVTLVPGISLPTRISGLSGRHSFSGTVTTRKFTPFDQLAQFVIPGSPQVPVTPKSGSWSATYTFHQYIRETRVAGKVSGWGVFGLVSVADAATNPVSRSINVGLGGSAPFKNRLRDQFGIVYSFTGVSRKLRSILDSVFPTRNEESMEAFYNFSITPWLSLTADLQIVRPVTRSAQTSVIPGARLVVHF